jgi:hypothetical protein
MPPINSEGGLQYRRYPLVKAGNGDEMIDTPPHHRRKNALHVFIVLPGIMTCHKTATKTALLSATVLWHD